MSGNEFIAGFTHDQALDPDCEYLCALITRMKQHDLHFEFWLFSCLVLKLAGVDNIWSRRHCCLDLRLFVF